MRDVWGIKAIFMAFWSAFSHKKEWGHLLERILYTSCYSIISIYLFVRHTPSNEYYVPGSPQHAIKVKDKNKADSKKGIKVHSVSVLYSRKESEDKNSSCQFMV